MWIQMWIQMAILAMRKSIFQTPFLQGGDKLKGAKAVDMNTVPGSWFNIAEQLWTRSSRKFSMAGVPHHYNHNHYNQQQPDFV